MKVVSSVFSIQDSFKESVVSVGNFDGIHLGHRELLKNVVLAAKKNNMPSVIMTFEPHPVKVLFPQKNMKRIFSFKDQEEVLTEIGVDYFIKEPFSRTLSEKTPQQFLTDWILKPLKPKKLVVGYDFNFGANRAGGIDFLEKKSQEYSFELQVVPPYKFESNIVSSSLVRDKIENGEVDYVEKLLGRPFYIEGLVEKGAGRGRQLGFPTANIFTKAELYPKKGVYLCRVISSSKTFFGVTNVGTNPTFENGTRHPIQVECHILDFDSDIYGEALKVEFLQTIREEKKFESVGKLVEQIQKDIKWARGIINEFCR